ncbi:MAG: beta-ketoacyl synthase N-terminal-like domain-containing protein [Proteobacteria bacterium]|nr:beta-ketoacyl synthase N-terminal-like domain-containing protein [Pseudomonadota bacterium]
MSNVLVTGSGFVTKFGLDLETLRNNLVNPPHKTHLSDYSLRGFDVTPLLTNKRVMRSVGWYHGFGLAAIELCRKSAQIDRSPISPARFGAYVGAQPSSLFDNENYVQSVLASKIGDGTFSEKKFGSTCMDTLGTTLLLGLPNNVLCYGSMILNAKGPNSNYVSGDVSGLLALCNGAWKIGDGKLDGAAVGGYSMASDEITLSMLGQQKLLFKTLATGKCEVELGVNRGTIPSDGSVFLMLESEASAHSREVAPIAKFLGAGTAFSGRLRYLDDLSAVDSDSAAVNRAISQCMHNAKVDPKDIGIIFASGSGVAYVDGAENSGIKEMQKKFGMDCPVVSLSPLIGNLMEASGLLEVVFAKEILQNKTKLPPVAFFSEFTSSINADKNKFMVVRSSLAGDKVCALFETC